MLNKLIRSMIKKSGGSVDKINFGKCIDLINDSFIFNSRNYWLGVVIEKSPLDLMILQEIMFEKRPDTIVECGTLYGGSAYYMACMMDLMNIDGKIITIDHYEYPVQAYPKRDLKVHNGKVASVEVKIYQAQTHPKIEYMRSDCLTAKIPKLRGKTMVILDCYHSDSHVYAELEKYSKIVTVGQYLIVEDTIISDKINGPVAAVKKFLKNNKNFIVDKSKEKYGITSNPGGYLLRVS